MIGGGKFANGAVTAAFQHLFNAEAHQYDEDAVRLEARATRRYIRGYIKDHGGDPIPLSESQLDSLMAESALEVRDAHFEKDGTLTYLNRLRKADSSMYSFASRRFVIDGTVYFGGEINYYFLGMAEAARGKSSADFSAFSLAYRNRAWNVYRAAQSLSPSRMQKIPAADYWAARGYSYYEIHGPK